MADPISTPRNMGAFHAAYDPSQPQGANDSNKNGPGAQLQQYQQLQQMKNDIANQKAPIVAPVQPWQAAQFNNFQNAKQAQLGPASQAQGFQATNPNVNQNFAQGQAGLMNQLQVQAAGGGPSLAGGMLRQGQERNLAQQAALASSQGGRNAAMTQRGLMTQAQGANQQLSGDIAQARMQEQLNAQNQLAGVVQAGRAGNLGEAQYGQAGNQFNANLGQQNAQFNAGQANQFGLQQGQMNQQTNLANAANWQQAGEYNASNWQQAKAQNQQMAQQAALANQQANLGQQQINAQGQQYATSQQIAGQQFQQNQQMSYEEWQAQQDLAKQAMAQGNAQFNVSAGQNQQALTAGYIGAGAAVAGAVGGAIAQSDRKSKKSIKRADDKLSEFLDFMNAKMNGKSISDENQKELSDARLNTTPENAKIASSRPASQDVPAAAKAKPAEKSAGEKALGVLGGIAEAVSVVMSPIAWSSQKIVEAAQDNGQHSFGTAPTTTAGQVAGAVSPKSSFAGALSDENQKNTSNGPNIYKDPDKLASATPDSVIYADKLSKYMKGAANLFPGVKPSGPAKPGGSGIENKIMSGSELGIADYMSSSDIKEKDLSPETRDKLSKFLNDIKPYEYSYKNPELPGAGEGRFVSPMAQDLEKSELGKSAVMDTEQGKMVDYAKLLGVITAGLAMEHERINKLEGKKGKK